MRTIFFICFLFFTFNNFYSQEFNFKIIETFNFKPGHRIINIDKYFYVMDMESYGEEIAEINLETNEIEWHSTGGFGFQNLITEYKGNLILSSVSKGGKYHYRDIDLKNKQSKTFSFIDLNAYKIMSHEVRMEYYQNDIFFIQKKEFLPHEYKPMDGEIVIFNYNNKLENEFPAKAKILDISPDKMHLLFVQGDGEICIYNIQNREIIKGFGYCDPYFSCLTNAQFISNHIILSRVRVCCSAGQNATYELFTIDKPKRPVYILTKVNEKLAVDIKFSKDICKALLYFSNKCTLIDTTPFRDWLDAKGLLFHQTTGVATDSDLRVRENPNLEAQIFGLLNKGDEVEVLDRSGIKTQVGSITASWYKIRRPSDALEGWCFGGYLQLE